MGPWRAGLSLLSLGLWPVCAPARRDEVVLNVGRALNESEAATVVVRVGVLRRGHEIVVTTTSGQLTGTISPFGIGAGNRRALTRCRSLRESSLVTSSR